MLRGISILMGVLMLVTISAASAAAGEKLDVVITTDDDGPSPADTGTFVTSGAAAAYLCASGTWGPGDGRGLHWISDDTFKVDIEKVYTCDDGSDRTFTLRLRATITPGVESVHPRWMVVDASGFDPAPKGSGEIVAGTDGEVFVGLMTFN